MQSSQSSVAHVIVKLVDKNNNPLQGVKNEIEKDIQIFEQGKELPCITYPNLAKCTFTLEFNSKHFGSKDKLLLTLKLPRAVITNNSKRPFMLVDSDLATIKFHLKRGANIEFPPFCYETHGGIISGIVYFDEKKNLNPNDNPPLPGVKVALRQNSTQRVFEVMTDAQGAYFFDDLDTDFYQLRLELTLDAEKFNLDPGLLGLSDHEQTIYLDEKEEQECNFGYRRSKGTVRGIVYLDADRNGHRFGNEPGLSEVIVTLDNNGATKKTKTKNGEYSFEAFPGTYTLNFFSVINVGEEYILTSAESQTQTITIEAGKTVYAEPVGYQPELYGIEGKVTYKDDDNTDGIGGVLVTAFDEDGNEVDRVLTNGEGEYFINTHRSGTFIVEFPERFFDGRLLTPNKQKIEVHSVAKQNAVYFLSADRNGGGISCGGVSSGGNARDALLDIASYMPTAQDNFTPSGRGGGGDRGSGNLKQVVDSAFNEVLGRNLRNDDPKAFLASLERAFTAEEVKGKTQYKWTPRSYAVQTELGGKISGAQASLYHRAKIAIDDALPLLDGLKPLRSDYDQEEVEAARAIVRTEMLELVSELGLEGGPRIQRVNHIFDLIDTQFRRFRNVFGLDRADVITVEEEQNFTNFLIIEDYIKGLRDAWGVFTKDFTGTSSGYLGTQLVLLTRTLSVVAESVAEAYRAMENVGLGPSERRTIPITFSEHDNSSIYLEDLMSWIEHFASQEAPDLIRDGGKRGVNAIQPVAVRLSELTKSAIKADVTHVGFKTERVRRALRELASQLDEVSRLAKKLEDKNKKRQ